MDSSSGCGEPEQKTDEFLPQSELSNLLHEVIVIADFLSCGHRGCGCLASLVLDRLHTLSISIVLIISHDEGNDRSDSLQSFIQFLE